MLAECTGPSGDLHISAKYVGSQSKRSERTILLKNWITGMEEIK